MTPIEYNQARRLELEALKALGWIPWTADPGTQAEVEAVKAWQQSRGLVPDGMAGPGTWAELRKVHAPASGWLSTLPRGYDAIRAVYGDLRETEGHGGRVTTSTEWNTASLARVTLTTGHKVTMHKAIAEEFRTLFDLAVKLSGYSPRSVQTWVPRHKLWNPNKPLSLHSWAIAFDVDPAQNGYGVQSGTMLDRHPAFAAVFRAAGWSCGIDWKTDSRDPMHIQAAAGA